MTIILILIWYGLGVHGFIYWWTTEFDFKTTTVATCLFIGIMGPISYIVGYFIHRDYEGKTLINKKQ